VKTLFAVVVAALAIAGPAALAGTSAVTGYPTSMASLGDSITRAYDTCSTAYTDCPANSWSTGTNTAVNSLYSRILVANPAISGKNYNDAKTGAKMIDLAGQATTAVSQGVQYVTIMMGANDVCTSTVAGMTPTGSATNPAAGTVAGQLDSALSTISTGLPDARILVTSIPNVYHLWQIFHSNFAADLVWGFAKICQSLLANPNSTSSTDTARRQAVLQRVIDDNTVIAAICAKYIHCRFDNNAAFNVNFTTSQVTTRDYFHPSVSGQNAAAATEAAASFDFTDSTPPVSTATIDPSSGNVVISSTSTDLAGIEYNTSGGSGAWTRYTGPLSVLSGTTVTYRSVDVNGNVEASNQITKP
jgi:lysophospholipase L1-like esterase